MRGMSDRTLGLHVRARAGPGILHQLSGVIARHQGDITSVEIVERTPEESRVYFEIELPGAPDALVSDLRGLLVISLNMAGSVPDAAALVVTDPVQAGVMAVMAVADTAKFTVERLKRRAF
jgi:energy-converting hydrogenase B subunit Q